MSSLLQIIEQEINSTSSSDGPNHDIQLNFVETSCKDNYYEDECNENDYYENNYYEDDYKTFSKMLKTENKFYLVKSDHDKDHQTSYNRSRRDSGYQHNVLKEI